MTTHTGQTDMDETRPDHGAVREGEWHSYGCEVRELLSPGVPDKEDSRFNLIATASRPKIAHDIAMAHNEDLRAEYTSAPDEITRPALKAARASAPSPSHLTDAELRENIAKSLCACDEQDGGPPWDYWPEDIKHGVSKRSYRERADAAMREVERRLMEGK
jgi:hypothetical protein